jgi:hypothetical protein
MLYETVIITVLGGTAAAFGAYMMFIRPKMDSSAEHMAEAAFQYAADYLAIRPKGKVPAVTLKKSKFKVNGKFVVGRHSWRALFGWVYYEKVTVVDNEYIISNLVREMIHVHRARLGLKPSEEIAEAAEAAYREIAHAGLSVSG